MSVCMGYESQSGWKCQRTATREVTAACEHEHVGERDLCAAHIMDLKDGRMNCGDCGESRLPHTCKLVLIPSKVPDLRGVPLEELGRSDDGAAFSPAI